MNLDFNLLEITYRNAIAPSIIAGLKKRFPSLIIGAGTLRSPKMVKDAVEAGADFGLSPALNPDVVHAARHHKLPFIPGINNPTHLEEALSLGFTLIKFFPAEASGGVKMIKSLASPYPEARFMPTGGIDDANFESYLNCRNVASIGGTWFLDITTKEMVDISRLMALFKRIETIRSQVN